MAHHLIDISDLTIRFDTDEGAFLAVENISFHVDPGEIVGLVGESGCGKSVTALSLLRLIPSPPGTVESGTIRFRDEDLLSVPVSRMRAIRGKSIGMIFQESGAALSPLHRVGKQMVETLRLHETLSPKQALAMAGDWLGRVGIPEPGRLLDAWPFQLSGGMQQRIMIAMTLMLGPELIIADEPTTALDVTIQAQVFDLIRQMKQNQTAILLITHDMGVVWEMCNRILVMYAGTIVEKGTREDIFDRPAHPYTRGLLKSVPGLTVRSGPMAAIPGNVPSPLNYPQGCRFHDRCPHAFAKCEMEAPGMYACGGDQYAACFLLENGD